MQELIEQFIEDNDVEFKLVVVVNGEEIVKYTSNDSFDDVTGYSDLADRSFERYVMASLEDEKDLREEDELENLLDEKRSRNGTL